MVMYKFGLDTTGLDPKNGTSEVLVSEEEAIKGVAKFLDETEDVAFVLSGDKDTLDNLVAEYVSPEKIRMLEILDTSVRVESNGDVVLSDKEKVDASGDARKYLNALKETPYFRLLEQHKKGNIDAVVSGTNTAAMIIGASTAFRRLSGYRGAPPLGTEIPNKKGDHTFLLDVGATAGMNSVEKNMKYFAMTALTYCQEFMGKGNPRIALVTSGLNRGHQDRMPEVLRKVLGDKFFGTTDFTKLFSGDYDAIIAEGYMGNIALKTMEEYSSFLKAIAKGFKEGRVHLDKFRALWSLFDGFSSYQRDLLRGSRKGVSLPTRNRSETILYGAPTHLPGAIVGAAHMGIEDSSIGKPLVGMISFGEEVEKLKRFPILAEAHDALEERFSNYLGPVEPKGAYGIFEGTANVIVTDFETQKVMMDVCYSMAEMIRTIPGIFFRGIGDNGITGSFAAVKDLLDKDNYNGTPFLNLGYADKETQSPARVFKIHGSTSSKGLTKALHGIEGKVRDGRIASYNAGLIANCKEYSSVLR